MDNPRKWSATFWALGIGVFGFGVDAVGGGFFKLIATSSDFGTGVGSTRAGGGARLRVMYDFALTDAPPARGPTGCLFGVSDGVLGCALALADDDGTSSH